MTTTSPATTVTYGPAMQKMLAAFPAARERSNGWWYHPDNPTFDFREDEHGWIRIHSWTGQSDEAILSKGNLAFKDIRPGGHHRIIVRDSLDLLELSHAKLIDWRFLDSLGVTDGYKYRGRSYVKIPYHNADGTQHTKIKIRKAISGNYKHCWDEGTPGAIIPYGLDRLAMARSAGYLFIGEGETDAWACWLHKVAYLGVPGASIQKCLLGLDFNDIPKIYILHEPDQMQRLLHNGESFYRSVHNALRAGGYKGEIFCIDFEETTGCKDPSDLHIRLYKAGEASQFSVAMGQARDQAIPAEDFTDQADNLPQIIVEGQLREITQLALAALIQQEQEQPTLFTQHGKIKRIGRDEKQRPIITDVGESELRNILTATANYYRSRTTKTGEVIRTSVAPPKDVVQSILALRPAEMPFPPIDAIVQIPTLRPDGTVLDIPGYDSATALYYMPQYGLSIPEIPAQPTQEDARRAMTFVSTFIQDFPWEGPADHANALGLQLTTISRQMFKHVPVGLVDATKQGTGKGLFTDTVTIPATGSGASALPQINNDDEFDKRVTALLLQGETMIVIDNVEQVLRSPLLAKILTSEYHKGRVLGQSKMVDVAQRATWIANGNNLQVGGDIPRRSYRMRMICQNSDPGAREDFLYPDLDTTIREKRGEIIAALLTVARAWFAAGCPPPTKKLRKMATFTRWCEVIGGMLSYAGVTGFLENVEALRKEADVDGNAWTLFLETWKTKLGSAEFTTAQLIEKLNADKELATVLPEPLGSMYLKEDKSLSRKIGKVLAKQNGTPYGKDNLRLVKGEEKHSKVATFKVVVGSENQYPAKEPPIHAQNDGVAGYAVSETNQCAEEKSMGTAPSHDVSGSNGHQTLSHEAPGGYGLNQTTQTPQTSQIERKSENSLNQYPANAKEPVELII